MSWEIKLESDNCPYSIESRIDKLAIKCQFYSNKNKKCNKNNCPIKRGGNKT